MRLRFLLVILITVVVTGLSPNYVVASQTRVATTGAPICPGAVQPLPRADWTIMIYMNGDNDLVKSAIDDFNEMAQVNYSPKVNVVLQMDLIDGDDTDESWSETRRFLMRKGLKPTRSCSLSGFSEEANMGSLTTLAEFVFWAKAKYPANRYALIIWSHADGWRFMDKSFAWSNRETLATRRRRSVAAATELLAKNSLTTASLSSLYLEPDPPGTQYRSLSEDFTNEGDRLFVREIQDALEWVFRDGQRLDLIGFDACLMQMIETAYALRRVSNILVGSEELVPGTGFSYDGWLQRLVNNPGMNGSDLGKLLVQSYRATYEVKEPATTLAALDLSKDNMNRLATAVTALAKYLIYSVDEDLEHIKTAREETTKFAPSRNHHGIDLHRFALLLSQSGADPGLKARAKEVKDLIEKMIIDWYAGRLRQGKFGSRGLAIYFPENESLFSLDPFHDGYCQRNIYYVVQFVAEQEWDQFLEAYFKRVTGRLN